MSGIERRAARALERQLAYQQARASRLRRSAVRVMAWMAQRSAAIRARLDAIKPIPDDARVLEVGCGAHGLIFFFGTRDAVGVDPLADHYRSMLPDWQNRVRTIAAPGELLPFPDASFDVVLCDNVVDHAEDPRRILREIARVMKPGALLYFEVNVHHPLYRAAAALHAGWRALGLPFEITPFADHTYHFTRAGAARLFDGLALEKASETDTIAAETARQRRAPLQRSSDLLKRIFFKNAAYEVIAIKSAS